MVDTDIDTEKKIKVPPFIQNTRKLPSKSIGWCQFHSEIFDFFRSKIFQNYLLIYFEQVGAH